MDISLNTYLFTEVPIQVSENVPGQLVFSNCQVVGQQPLSEGDHVRVRGHPLLHWQVLKQVQ